MKKKSQARLPDQVVIQARLNEVEALKEWGRNNDINLVDKQRRSLLMHTSIEGCTDALSLLMELGADVNLKDNKGHTALHFASSGRLPSIAEQLINNGAEVDCQDEWGNTPLSNAVFESRGWGDMIELLLSAGANPYLENKYGVSPYSLAHDIANFDVKQFFKDVPSPM